MRPLKVTCWLNSPLAGDPPRLDALLEWVMSCKMRSVLESSNGARHATGTVKACGVPVVPGAIPIPLERRRVEGYQWMIPACSDPIIAGAIDGVEHFAKRFSTENSSILAESERRIIVVSSGPLKSYRLPLRMRPVDRIVWFCAGRSGDRAPGCEVRKLLRKVFAVGKKTSFGFGQIARWEVELIDEDWSWFAPSEAGTVLMRTLPASARLPRDLTGFKCAEGAPVAPYWMRENYCRTVVPC
jgi:hypothetical protein